MAMTTDKERLRKLLESDKTFGLTLLVILIDQYGVEALDWEGETIEHELQEDFGVNIPRINMDKIQAMLTLMTTDLFYVDWVVFNFICEALNNDPVDVEILDPATPEQMAWAWTEAKLLEGADDSDVPQVSPEVARYIGVILGESGLTRPPSSLREVADIPDTYMPSDDLKTDSIFYQGQFNREQSDIDYIDGYVLARLEMLLDELNNLPLHNRDQDSWQSFYKAAEKKLQQIIQKSHS